jgi:hypothetical protein
MSCFSFYHFSFFSYKIREQENGTSIAQGEGLAPVGGGDVRERGLEEEYRAIKCAHVSKYKNYTVETTPGSGE